MTNTTSTIYDLGYQRYDGVRLGRRHAWLAVYTQSLRGIFGLGRSWWAKLSAFGIVALAFIPPLVLLSLAAVVAEDYEIVKYEEYYILIQPLIVIFCALVAPDLVGRDQQTRVLSLYFSRALRREDYALAKLAAFITSLLVLTTIPLLFLVAGNAVSTNETFSYIWDNWRNVPAIVASGALLSSLVGTMSLAVAAYVPKRTYSTVAIAALFFLSTAIATAVFEAAGPGAEKLTILLSPFNVIQGLTYWLFGAPLPEDSQILEADLWGGAYVLVAIAASAVAFGMIIQRYRRVSA